MRDNNKDFQNLGAMGVEKFVNASFGNDKDPNKGKDEMLMMIIATAMILFVGAEGMRVLLRTNFGRSSISRLRIGLFSLVFYLLGIVPLVIIFNFLAQIMNGEEVIPVASFTVISGCLVLLTGTAIYWTMATLAWKAGLKERDLSYQSQAYPMYGGDSILFGYLIKRGVSKNVVQCLIEPAFVSAIGFFLSGIYIGIPIFLCGISLFLYQCYEYYKLRNSPIEQTLYSKGFSQSNSFTEVE